MGVNVVRMRGRRFGFRGFGFRRDRRVWFVLEKDVIMFVIV